MSIVATRHIIFDAIFIYNYNWIGAKCLKRWMKNHRLTSRLKARTIKKSKRWSRLKNSWKISNSILKGWLINLRRSKAHSNSLSKACSSKTLSPPTWCSSKLGKPTIQQKSSTFPTWASFGKVCPSVKSSHTRLNSSKRSNSKHEDIKVWYTASHHSNEQLEQSFKWHHAEILLPFGENKSHYAARFLLRSKGRSNYSYGKSSWILHWVHTRRD